jgi:hypothetical protein
MLSFFFSVCCTFPYIRILIFMMIKRITPEEFKIRMKEIQRHFSRDVEGMHKASDKLMADTLLSLEYTEGVQIFNELPKWYS